MWENWENNCMLKSSVIKRAWSSVSNTMITKIENWDFSSCKICWKISDCSRELREKVEGLLEEKEKVSQ